MKLCIAGCYNQFLVLLKDYVGILEQAQGDGRIQVLHYLSIQPIRVGIRMNKLLFRV